MITEKALRDEFYQVYVLQEIEKLMRHPTMSNQDKLRKMRAVFSQIENKYEGTLSQKVRQWIEDSAPGKFCSWQIEKFFDLKTENEKKNLHTILKREETKGRIMHEKTVGSWRKLENDLTVVDWKAATGETLNVEWPFEINKYFRTFPKTIAVFSGTPDAGKTAFFFEFIKRNQKRWGDKIHYFCSDMGADEMKDRLLMHEDIDVDDWNFYCYEREGNFADCTQPDDINIYDFIEVHGDDFPYVGRWIKEIWHKLNRGIALIGLQKMWGATLGRGGLGTIEKARLYITTEFDKEKQCGVMRVEKCKSKVRGTNFTGYINEFKLYDGWKFHPGMWHPDYGDTKSFA